MIAITELKLTSTLGKPRILRAVKAADPERPCVGCALRGCKDCFDDLCADYMEDGYHFEEVIADIEEVQK